MAADEQVIQGILQQIETAWNRYDSVSLAAAFVEDANFIQIFGGQLDGRAAIEAAHRHIFETIYRGSHASFVLRSIRFLRPDVAVVFARAHVKFKEANEAREIETRPTLIVINVISLGVPGCPVNRTCQADSQTGLEGQLRRNPLPHPEDDAPASDAADLSQVEARGLRMRAFSPSHTIMLTPHAGPQCLKLEVNTRFLLKTRNNLEQVSGVRIS